MLDDVLLAEGLQTCVCVSVLNFHSIKLFGWDMKRDTVSWNLTSEDMI